MAISPERAESFHVNETRSNLTQTEQNKKLKTPSYAEYVHVVQLCAVIYSCFSLKTKEEYYRTGSGLYEIYPGDTSVTRLVGRRKKKW